MTPSDTSDRSPLSDVEIADLHAAIDDEYMARATYARVIADFGDVAPFVNIVESEGRHVAALERVFIRYGLAVPADTWPGRAPRYASLLEACTAAVEAEIANRKLYEGLLARTTHDDVAQVYWTLQEASQHRHLPAFQRCAERESRHPRRHRTTVDAGRGAGADAGTRTDADVGADWTRGRWRRRRRSH